MFPMMNLIYKYHRMILGYVLRILGVILSQQMLRIELEYMMSRAEGENP
jgi:hypothetical protein